MAKNKRERRKKCRRKYSLTPAQADQLNAEQAWNVPEVHLLLDRRSPAPHMTQQFAAWRNSASTSQSFLVESRNEELLTSLDRRCADDLRRFIADIHRNFTKTRLGRILNDCLPSGVNCSPTRLINLTVTSRQMSAFTERLFGRVFPTDLLGDENWRRLRRNIVYLFSRLRLRGVVATFDEIFRHIRLNEIAWLRNLPFKFKFSIIRNILQCITSFFINVLCTFFYSTLNTSGQIVHYRRRVWRIIERHGFTIMRAQRMLKVVTPDEKRSIIASTPIHYLRFKPKKIDVRPIVTFKNENIMRELAEVRAILTLIIDENPAVLGWGITNLRIFNFAYRKMILDKRKNIATQNAQMFWCTMDLANCFTTINHDILEKILSRLIPITRTFTVVHAVVENEKAKRRSLVRVAGSNFVHAMSRLRMKRDSERLASNPISVQLCGAEVLERIRRFVLYTVILYKGTLYRCRRGIAQGNPLSVKLCNIYLGAMERMLFPNRPKELFCRRYIDDYFVVSANKECIVQMVNKIQNDGACFGIQVNSKKIILTFSNDRIREARRLKPNRKIAWCGFAFNTKSLCMTVDYQRYRHCFPRFSVNMKLHSAVRFRFICAMAKRLLKGRCVALRLCARTMYAKQRRSLRADFCKFARDFYFRHFIRQFRLDMRDHGVRHFWSQMMRWVANSFREKYLPDAAKFSINEF